MYCYYILGLFLMMGIAYLVSNIANMSKSNPDKLFKMIKHNNSRPVTYQEQIYITMLIVILISWLLMVGIK